MGVDVVMAVVLLVKVVCSGGLFLVVMLAGIGGYWRVLVMVLSVVLILLSVLAVGCRGLC